MQKLTTEYETRLALVGQSPADEGVLEMIVRRPGVDQREVLQQAELSLTDGLVGDSWRERASRRRADDAANPETQVTLMNSRIIQLVAQDQDRWPLAGDQLFVDLDLSMENLPPGQRLAIGTAVIEISAVPHTGCDKFTARFGGDATRFVNSPEGRQQRRRGANARVVQAGVIRQGDVVRKVGG